VHQAKAQAVAGALLLGTVAAVSHVAMPTFEADKFALSMLLDAGLVEDDDAGTLRARAAAKPVLAPFSLLDVRAALYGAAAQVSPFQPISDEEYAHLRGKDPILIGAKRCGRMLKDAGQAFLDMRPVCMPLAVCVPQGANPLLCTLLAAQ
jgi:hypothetical protein